MPRSPKGERGPANVNTRAVMNAKIATDEIEDEVRSKEIEKNPAAVALGRLGGRARANSLSKQKRTRIAKKAAMARWAS